MSITAPTRALLLLTADLDGTAPLNGAAFERLAGWLRRRGLQPADLVAHDDPAPLLVGRPDPAETARILALLRRGPVLAAALERWQAAGVWVLGRGDPGYPRRLKRRLRAAAPALLFGCGDRALLNRGGIALVGGAGGGPDGGPEAADFAAGFGTAAAASGLTVISGNRGAVEMASVRAALSRGGGVVAVLPDRLMRESGADRLRRPTADGLLALVSTALPEEGASGEAASGNEADPVLAPTLAPTLAPSPWTVAADNCLYGLADAALLVAVGRTDARWAGAVAASEHGWVPLWARRADPGSAGLAGLGVGLLSGDPVSPRSLLEPPTAPRRSGTAPSLPATPMGLPMPGAMPGPVPVSHPSGFAEAPAPFEAGPGGGPEGGSGDAPEDGNIHATAPVPAAMADGERGAHLRLVASAPRAGPAARPDPAGFSLFELFVQRLAGLLAGRPLGVWRIAEALGLLEAQAEVWLRQAEAAGHVSLDPVTRSYRCHDR